MRLVAKVVLACTLLCLASAATHGTRIDPDALAKEAKSLFNYSETGYPEIYFVWNDSEGDYWWLSWVNTSAINATLGTPVFTVVTAPPVTSTTGGGVVTTVTATTVPHESTTVTTLPTCQRSRVCSVEFDSDGDGVFDCCNKTNSALCRDCLDYCMMECGKLEQGVSSCFGNSKKGMGCECTGREPVCYELTTTTLSRYLHASTTSTTLPANGRGVLYYIVVMMLAAVLSLGVVFFVRNL